MINRKGFICQKIIKNNSGTTMMEVLVSFVVLMIVMAALYGMVRISSNLRMRAVDTANIREEFNSEIYKNHSSDKVDTYYYNGKCAPDRLTMFTLKLSDSTDNSNLRVGTSSVDRTKFENSIIRNSHLFLGADMAYCVYCQKIV